VLQPHTRLADSRERSDIVSTVATLANTANVIKRHRGAESVEYIDAKRKHAAASIEAAIRKNLATAPPLTEDQTERLTALLRGGVQ